jgi:acetyl/propionyl-CoA carboxylase alpha subunit
MIAKLIAWAETRDLARRRVVAALRRFPILGIRTNIPFLVRVIEHPRFGEGTLDTAFLDRDGRGLCDARSISGLDAALAVAAADDGAALAPAGASGAGDDPWDRLNGWRQ